MVLGPKDAEKKALPDTERLKALEDALDDALVEGLRAGGHIAIDEDLIPSGIVGQTIVKHYRDAGWSVSYHSDQRDGAYYSFTPSKKRQEFHDDKGYQYR